MTTPGSMSRRAQRVRVAGIVLAIWSGLATIPLLVLVVFAPLQAVHPILALLACGIPYLPVTVLGLSLGLVWASRRRGVAVGLLVATLVLGSIPWWPTPASAAVLPTAQDLRIVSLNTEFGQADPETVVALASSADLIAFQENTPEFVTSLVARGLGDDFPYRLGTAEYAAYGTMIWSRTPIVLAATGRTQFTSLVVRTTARGIDWTVAALHTVSPLDSSRTWESDAAAAADLLSPYVAEHLVVVGDFNAIDEHVTLRRIRAVGLTDAMTGWSRRTGDGWQASWPSDTGVPPILRIDHALHSASVAAWRPEYVTVPGTDHRAVDATFRPV